jgi:hypothetical protein
VSTANRAVHPSSPIYAILREARLRAKGAGARDIEERSIVGDAVHALVDLAEEVHADLDSFRGLKDPDGSGPVENWRAATVHRRSRPPTLASQ